MLSIGHYLIKLRIMNRQLEDSINVRFKELISLLGKSNNSFALSIGKTSTTINNIVEGKSKPGYELLEAVFQMYPQISRDWLLMGEGEIYRIGNNENQSSNYLEEYLERLEKQFSEMKEMFQSELAVKNQQIAAKDRQIEKLIDSMGKLDVSESATCEIIPMPITTDKVHEEGSKVLEFVPNAVMLVV